MYHACFMHRIPDQPLDDGLKWSFVDSVFWYGECDLVYLFVSLETLWLAIKVLSLSTLLHVVSFLNVEALNSGNKSGTLLTKCSETVATIVATMTLSKIPRILHFILCNDWREILLVSSTKHDV